MPEKFIVDSESVKNLATLLEESGLTEIEYQVGTHRIRVVRGNVQPSLPHFISSSTSSPISAAPSPTLQVVAPAPAELPTPQGEAIASPMVGTVYLSAEPGAAPFIKTGDFVKKGDTLLIVEAMKVMNPIRAPRDGKVLEICAEDTKPVEFGEVLVILE
ncbi:MAG: acetyl-CoA carboxylase biotin carboxyl carrier protein [Proteobacteria bacterium]|nr:acetyl-CoA carboxylase biotin carboxyl carrier protein [Pseudomonadota bacterium]